MANIVSAVVSDGFRTMLARFYSRDWAGPVVYPTYFKIGCGGWVDPGGGREPVTPSSVLTDITANTSGLGFDYTDDDSKFSYTKAFVLAPTSDWTYVAPRRVRLRCFLDTGEGNGLTVAGNAPEYYEIGVFDSNNVMLVYSTFPIEVKTSDKTLEHYIYIDF